jgi:hypothetical protein
MTYVKKVEGIIVISRSRGLLIVYTLSSIMKVTSKVVTRSSYSSLARLGLS